MKIDRRDFIKSMAVLAVAPALASITRLPVVSNLFTGPNELKKAPSDHSKDLGPLQGFVDGFGTVVDPTKRWAYVLDVGACIGCRRCQWACKEENNEPDSISPPWIEVFQMDEVDGVMATPTIEQLKKGEPTNYTTSPAEGKFYMPLQCNHCDNAPCVEVCPTGATYKAQDGLVLMDYHRCIGCRICVAACPYSNRRFNWEPPDTSTMKSINPLVPVRTVGVPEKCTFCVHRTRRGKLPRCVEVCPVNARHFGDLNDPNSTVSLLLKQNLAFRLLEELNTKPRFYYITRGKKFYNQ